MKIYKYPVGRAGAKTVHKGRFRKLLDIQAQGDDVFAWFEIRDYNPEIEVEIISVGTGWDIPDEAIKERRYFKTVQDRDGFVWHYYVREVSENDNN